MKKIILIVLSIFSVAFAVDKAKVYESEIIETLIKSIFHKKNVKVCFYNFNFSEKKQLSNLLDFQIVENCNRTDIILVKNIEEKKSFDKPALALDYLSFKNCQNCVGGFYWRKGRPQIILFKEVLNYFNLKPDKNLKKFIISKKLVIK